MLTSKERERLAALYYRANDLQPGKHYPIATDYILKAMKRAEDEAQDAVSALRRGNTALLEALMHMVNQFFIEREDGVLSHSYMSAEEGAIAVLLAAGMAEEVPSGGYRLLWDKLKERELADEHT